MNRRMSNAEQPDAGPRHRDAALDDSGSAPDSGCNCNDQFELGALAWSLSTLTGA